AGQPAHLLDALRPALLVDIAVLRHVGRPVGQGLPGAAGQRGDRGVVEKRPPPRHRHLVPQCVPIPRAIPPLLSPPCSIPGEGVVSPGKSSRAKRRTEKGRAEGREVVAAGSQKPGFSEKPGFFSRNYPPPILALSCDCSCRFL